MTDIPSDIDQMPEDFVPIKPQSYAERAAEIKAQQQGKKYEEIRASLPNVVAELDNMPSQPHNWIDRGDRFSCEHAGHSHHYAFKRR